MKFENFAIGRKILDHGRFNRLFGKKVIHVEMPHIKDIKLYKHLKRHRSKCYCLCPSNYEYIKTNFGIKISRKAFEKHIKRFYLALKREGINLQLHVHLSQYPEYVSYEDKKELIEQAYGFFVEELEIVPSEIVFGWYAHDKEAEEIANKLGLKIIGRHFHIYDYWL